MQLLKHFKELTLRPKNAKELKGLILKLAIQGKLTSNWRIDNPNIESASELLKKIMKDDIKGNYELSKKEIPFELPNTWMWSLLGKLCSVQTGKKDANYGTENGEYNFYTCAQKPIKSPTYTFEGESIILPGNGANVGLMTFVNEKFEAYQRTYVLNKFNHLYPLYIKTALEALWKDNLGKQYGSAINYIKMGNITEFKFPIPPLEEQKEIVRVVETLFKEVEQLEQLTVERISLKEDFVVSALHQLTTKNTQQEWSYLQEHFKSFFNSSSNIKKLRETVLQLAVQGKLSTDWRSSHPDTEDASQLLKRIQVEKAQLIADKKIKKEKALPAITKEEIPYELPDGWVWCRMQEVGLFERGKSKHRPRNDTRLFSDGKYPLIQTGEVSDAKNNGGKIKRIRSYYNDFGLAQSMLWSKGTLCITIAANIAETGFLDFDACFPDSVVGFVELIQNGNSLANYVEYFITITKSDLEKFAPSTAQKNINLGILNQLKFPLPPLKEQKAIVEKVNALMGLCDALEQEVQQSQEHSEMMMQSVLREVFEDGNNNK